MHLSQIVTLGPWSNESCIVPLQKPCRAMMTKRMSPPADKLNLLYLTYVKGVGGKIECGYRQLGVRPVFKLKPTLRQALMNVKNQRPNELKWGAVCEVLCGECEKVYIGETGRSLNKRLKKHQYAVRIGNMNNGIAWQSKHFVDWSSAKVKTHETNIRKRKILEVIEIQRHEHTPTWLWTATQLSVADFYPSRLTSFKSPSYTLPPPSCPIYMHMYNFSFSTTSTFLRSVFIGVCFLLWSVVSFVQPMKAHVGKMFWFSMKWICYIMQLHQ